MTVGIKVSKAGHGVGTATDDLLIVNDQYPIFKVQEEGQGTVTVNLGEALGTQTITHNLGHKSAVLVYAQQAEGSSQRSFVTGRTPFLEFGVDEVFINVEVKTDTFIVVAVAGGTESSDRSYKFHYYVTHEEM